MHLLLFIQWCYYVVGVTSFFKTSSLNEEVKRVCVSVSFPEYG